MADENSIVRLLSEEQSCQNVDTSIDKGPLYSGDYTYECLFRQSRSVATRGESSRSTLGCGQQFQLPANSVDPFDYAVRGDFENSPDFEDSVSPLLTEKQRSENVVTFSDKGLFKHSGVLQGKVRRQETLSAVDNSLGLRPTLLNVWIMSCMLLYIKGKKNGRMMLESIKNGPLVYPTIKENGQIRNKKYAELTEQEKLQDDCDVQATNIVLQGLPLDVYSLVNHCQTAKDIWDRVKLLMQGTELSYQESECKLHNEFDKFTSVKGESLYECYLRFAQLINDMHTIGMTTQQVQVNTTSPNALQPEWSKNQATIQDDRVTVQQVQGKQGQSFVGEGHMARQFTQPKRPRNSAWFKEKMLQVQAHESGQELNEEQLAFLADPKVADSQDTQTIIPQNDAFHIDDLDA
nr:hypothetical protein [Tanacetum cinerariifolium]